MTRTKVTTLLYHLKDEPIRRPLRQRVANVPGSGWRRTLFRLAMWTLERLGVHEVIDVRRLAKHQTVDCTKSLQELWEHEGNCRRVWEARGAVIIMGSRDFHRVAVLPEIREQFSHSVAGGSGVLTRQSALLGMQIVVVPWIDGCFVMPEAELREALARLGP